MKQLQGSKTAEGKQLTLYYTYVMFFIHYTVAEIAYLTFCLILNNEPAFTGIYHICNASLQLGLTCLFYDVAVPINYSSTVLI